MVTKRINGGAARNQKLGKSTTPTPRMRSSDQSAEPGTRATKATQRTLKIRATDDGVDSLLDTLDDATRADCALLDAWMRKATGGRGVMYGKAIAGYGTTTLRYADGRESPWMKMGFSPRKRALVLYGLLGQAADGHLAKLGKHETGKGCLYIKRLLDVDTKVLQRMIQLAASTKS